MGPFIQNIWHLEFFDIWFFSNLKHPALNLVTHLKITTKTLFCLQNEGNLC